MLSCATPATPSASVWCSFTYRPTRPSSRPGRSHSSHSGRLRSNGRARRRSTSASSSLAGTGGQRCHPHVLVDPEARGVDPQRPAEPPRGCAQHLPEAVQPVQAAADHRPHVFHIDLAVRSGERRTVEHGHGADVLAVADVLGPQHHEIGRRQPLDRHRPAHSLAAGDRHAGLRRASIFISGTPIP